MQRAANSLQSAECPLSASPDHMFAVQAGLRTLHEAGPEVKRAISGNLEELADVELETNTRRNMPFFGSVIQVGQWGTGSQSLKFYNHGEGS